MKIERRKIWWLSDPKRRRAGPSGLKTSTTSPLCPTLRIRSLSSTVVEFGRSSSRAPIFSPPSVSRARIFCSAWSRVCVLLFNNTGSPCACLRACVRFVVHRWKIVRHDFLRPRGRAPIPPTSHPFLQMQ